MPLGIGGVWFHPHHQAVGQQCPWCLCPSEVWGSCGERAGLSVARRGLGEKPTLVWIKDLEELGAADQDYLAHAGGLPARDVVPHPRAACGEESM